MRRFGFLLLLSFVLTPQAWAFSDDNYTAALKYFNKGYWTKAAKYFTRVTLSDPDNWRAFEGLGDCEFHLHHRAKAMAAYQSSLALNPNNKPLQDFVDAQTNMPPPPIAPEEPQAVPGSAEAVPTTPFPTLPRINSFDLRLDLGGGLSSPDDFNTLYALENAANMYGTMAHVDLGIDVDYTVNPHFQLGVGFTWMIKNPISITGQSGGVTETDQWHEQAVGGQVEGRFLMPAPSGNVIFAAELGYFTLSESAVYVSQTNGSSSASGVVDLGGSNLGGAVRIEYEAVLSPKTKMDFDLGYRLLRFSPITAVNPGGGSMILVNPDGTETWIDFSGPELSLSLILN